MSQFTAETLEEMFVYLGCANVQTTTAMDGAVPLESMLHLAGDSDKAVAELIPERLDALGSSWAIKSVWFRRNHLSLATVENVHWSAISQLLCSMRSRQRNIIQCAGGSFTDKTDAFLNLYYSEIDQYGRFLKFPIKKRHSNGLVVSKVYNPRWLLEIGQGSMQVASSDSESVYKDAGVSFLAPFLCGLAQSIPTYWKVATRFESICPSLTLLTDPTGIKEFWKLRDIPAGKKRRSALLHWVESHWRQTRKDPDVEVYVRKHLRGQQDITQGQFTAKITPSETDSIELEALKRTREELRKKKLDRRRRLKAALRPGLQANKSHHV